MLRLPENNTQYIDTLPPGYIYIEPLNKSLEVEIPGGRRVMVPVNFSRITRRGVHVRAILSAQFAGIPGTKSDEQVTRLEEEKIVAYFGAGLLYAEPSRAEPLV